MTTDSLTVAAQHAGSEARLAMRFYLAAMFCGASLQAAVMRGIVVDNYSGRPLARTVIALP